MGYHGLKAHRKLFDFKLVEYSNLGDFYMDHHYPSREEILSAVLKFYHKGNPQSAHFFKLNEDGSFRGYSHVNEATWSFGDDGLKFYTQSGVVSVVFENCSEQPGVIRLEGRHLIAPNDRIILCLDQAYEPVNVNDPQSTREQFRHEIDNLGWSIGKHTYGRPLIYSTGHQKLKIGSYTAIGHAVTIALAYHRPDFTSIFPFVVYKNLWPNVPGDVSDHLSRGGVEIGSDVWIGHGVFIGDGVKIGDGAVIGAHAVVTKDIPPYSIAVGNPATVKRQRFPDHISDRLLKLRWWDWPDEKVNYFIPKILSSDIESFLQEAEHH